MKNGKQYSIIAIILFVMVGALILSANTHSAKATNGLQLLSGTNKLLATTNVNYGSLVGTTSPIYMSAGLSTTTVPMYTYAADTVALNIAFSASSSPNSVLKWRYEYSSNAIDWYSDDLALSSSATTTVSVRDFPEYSWVYASSTGGTSVAAVAFKHVTLPAIVSPYTRAVFYMAAGSSPGGIVVTPIVKTNNVN